MIDSQLNILKQAQHYLSCVSTEQYTEVISPQFMSSAGAHIRHILDHYFAIKKGLSKGVVDYDKRSRGGRVELSRQAALQAIDEINHFLLSLSHQQLQQSIKLSTEISVEDQLVAIADTTVMREIIFAGSHAVHHYAMIKQIAMLQGINMANAFGIAPATASFLRKQSKEFNKEQSS